MKKRKELRTIDIILAFSLIFVAFAIILIPSDLRGTLEKVGIGVDPIADVVSLETNHIIYPNGTIVIYLDNRTVSFDLTVSGNGLEAFYFMAYMIYRTAYPLFLVVIVPFFGLSYIPSIITDLKKYGTVSGSDDIDDESVDYVFLFVFFVRPVFLMIYVFIPVYVSPFLFVILSTMVLIKLKNGSLEEKIKNYYVWFYHIFFSLLDYIVLKTFQAAVPITDRFLFLLLIFGTYMILLPLFIILSIPYGRVMYPRKEDIENLPDARFSIKAEMLTLVSALLTTLLLLNNTNFILFLIITFLLPIIAASLSIKKKEGKGEASILLVMIFISSILLMMHPASALIMPILSAGTIANKLLNVWEKGGKL